MGEGYTVDGKYVKEWGSKEVSTCVVKLYIAGDLHKIKEVCRQVCFDMGLCVTVTPTTYIYTGAAEEGAEIGLINYPRFPDEPSKIMRKAEGLGFVIARECCQNSFTVVAPNITVYHTRRKD